MDELQITAIAIAGVFLRIGVPLGMTFLLASFLRKLDSRWRREAEQEALELQMRAQRQMYLNLWLDQPCYEIRNCSTKEMENCPAKSQHNQPCWEIYRVNGSLANGCQQCEYRKEIFRVVDHSTI